MNTNGSPANGDSPGGRVLRENVKTKSEAPARATRRLADAGTELGGCSGEVPDAVGNDEFHRRRCNGQRVHRSKRELRAACTASCCARSTAARSIAHERSRPMTSHPAAASGTVFRAAPQPTSSATGCGTPRVRGPRRRAASRSAATAETGNRGRCAPGRAAGGSIWSGITASHPSLACAGSRSTLRDRLSAATPRRNRARPSPRSRAQ